MERPGIAPAGAVILVSGAVLSLIEIGLAYGGGVPGLAGHAVLLVVLLRLGWRQESPVQRVLLAMALLPLLRILSVVMPLAGLHPMTWYGLVGLPLLLGAWLAAHALGLARRDLGLGRAAPLPQIMIALSGPVLGLLAYGLFRPEALVPETGLEALLAVAILTVFAGFVEEFVFRGILQAVLQEALAARGIFVGAALYAVQHIATLNPGYALYMGAVGLFFGWAVQRTGNAWGVMAAHAAFSICLLLVGPLASL
jgi:membrane protease YdiL (CAAX protease family)